MDVLDQSTAAQRSLDRSREADAADNATLGLHTLQDIQDIIEESCDTSHNNLDGAGATTLSTEGRTLGNDGASPNPGPLRGLIQRASDPNEPVGSSYRSLGSCAQAPRPVRQGARPSCAASSVAQLAEQMLSRVGEDREELSQLRAACQRLHELAIS